MSLHRHSASRRKPRKARTVMRMLFSNQLTKTPTGVCVSTLASVSSTRASKWASVSCDVLNEDGCGNMGGGGASGGDEGGSGECGGCGGDDGSGLEGLGDGGGGDEGGGGGEGEAGGGDGVGGEGGGGLGAGWLGGGEGGIGGSEGGGIGGKMGWDTSTDKASVGRLRSVETAARTSSADRLPLTKVFASSTPPTAVTESTSATPWKATPVTDTPAPSRSGISAVKLPLVSERASTAVPVPPESCNARRSLGPECSAQSGELAWHASRSFAASRLASASGGTA